MISFDEISEPLDQRVSAGLARLAVVARQSDWHIAEAEGLTPTQAELMRFAASRPGGVRLSAAAAHAGISKPTASDAVTALQRKGLIEKCADPTDGRAIAVRVTADGGALDQRWPPSFEAIVGGLAEDEQETLLSLVTKMIRNLQERGMIAPQRTCVSCRYFRPNVAAGTREPHRCAFVDAPMGDRHLRIDCAEHQAAT